MSDLVITAADVLLPFVAAGASAVAAGSAEEAGRELYKAADSVLAKIRHRLGGKSKTQVEKALRDAMTDGLVTEGELEQLCTAYEAYRGTTSIAVSQINAKNSFVGTTNIDKFQA
jgi:hypothetical protein